MLTFWDGLLRRSHWLFLLVALLTLIFVLKLRDLRFDSSPSTLILSQSPENLYYEKMTRLFGSDQVLLIGLNSDDLLRSPQLEEIRELTDELEKIRGVKRVLSLTNATDIRGVDEEVQVFPLIPADLGTVDRATLASRLRANPFYEKNLVSTDLRTTSLIVFLEDFEMGKALARGREVTRKVRQVVSQVLASRSAFIGGLPEMELEGTESMIRDSLFLTPLTVLLVVGILIIVFRSARAVLLPMLVIALTLIWTIGALIWSGRPLKVTTLVLPSLLIANGSSYVIHFLAHYYRSIAGAYADHDNAKPSSLDKISYRALLLQTAVQMHRPILISAATTMAGFVSLIFTSIPAIRDLGIFATLGIFLSYFFCMTLAPSILAHISTPPLQHLPGRSGARRELFLRKLAHFNLHYRAWVFTVAVAGVAWSMWGIFHLKVHSDYLAYFRKSAPVVQAAEEFHRRLAGIAPLSVIVEAPAERTVLEPYILKGTESLQRKLKDTPGIDTALSIVDTLKLMNRAFHTEDPRFFELPSEPEIIQELVDLAESDPNGLIRIFISEDHRFLRILGRTHLFSSAELQGELERVEREGGKLFPPDVRVHATGTLVLMNQTSDQVASQQVRSLAISVLLIALIVVILFRSGRIGLLAMIPAGIPIVLFFGLIGWFNVPLNVNTSVIASIALGIAVDNCVHYLVQFQRNTQKGLSIPLAMQESLVNAGGPMIAAAMALAIGFLVFGFSSFVPVSNFGYLSAFIMMTNLLADIFLLPCLMLLRT